MRKSGSKASEARKIKKKIKERASAKKTAVNIDDLGYRRGRTGGSKETRVGCFTVCLLRAVGLIVRSKKVAAAVSLRCCC